MDQNQLPGLQAALRNLPVSLRQTPAQNELGCQPLSQMICTILFILLITFVSVRISHSQLDFFGVARVGTPILNSLNFDDVFGGKDRRTLKSDRCGQVRELEYIALPGTVFRIMEEHKRGTATIYRVETDEYRVPPGVKLYVDSRFMELQRMTPEPRQRTLPAREQVVAALKEAIGSCYVWGGNLQNGVPELAEWFYGSFRPGEKDKLILAGLDCSGLLYQATGGWTPRNTSQLLAYGRAVVVEGKKVDKIIALLEPLDLIVWNGHVVIVLDQHTAIESRLNCGKPHNGGVVTTPLPQRLQEIMRTRRALDVWPGSGKAKDAFVIRRWYGLQ